MATTVDAVDGWLSRREGEALYELARACRAGHGVIVEIGSWKGKSTIWLGNGSKAGQSVPIYAVDPHIGFPDVPETYGVIKTFEEFKRNIEAAGVDDVVTPLVMTSEEAAAGFTEPVALLFVDGVHQYEYVKSDFEYWFPKVRDGGVMVFHDT
ncbi:MAG TPA: class I SAM-dependent methyltransferase, partial [Acidimicrobiales bacterium]|nr:class I SAM-dependent methyltransferase [Acidimicrobiales bacterium]